MIVAWKHERRGGLVVGADASKQEGLKAFLCGLHEITPVFTLRYCVTN